MAHRMVDCPVFSTTAIRDAWYTVGGGNGANPVNGDICIVRTGIGSGVVADQLQIYDTAAWRNATSAKHRGDS